jgi:hypothetical protein
MAHRRDVREGWFFQANAAHSVRRRDSDTLGAGITNDGLDQNGAVINEVDVELNGWKSAPWFTFAKNGLTDMVTGERTCLVAMPITTDQAHAKARLAPRCATRDDGEGDEQAAGAAEPVVIHHGREEEPQQPPCQSRHHAGR